MPSCILDPRLKQLGEEKVNEWRLWFDNRLDNAIEAAEVEAKIESGESMHRAKFNLFDSRMIVISPFSIVL